MEVVFVVIPEVIQIKFCRNLALVRVDALGFHTWLVSEIHFMTVLQGLLQNTNYKCRRKKNTNKCCRGKYNLFYIYTYIYI